MGELTELVVDTVKNLPNLPTHLKIAFSIFTLIFLFQTVSLLLRPTIEGIDLPKFYIFIFIVAPIPRDILLSETTFRHIDQDGKDCGSKPLGYWKKTFDAKKKAAQQRGDFSNKVPDIEDAEVFISLVVPAFNEEERLGKMLAEAVDYLEQQYGIAAGAQLANGNLHQRKSNKTDSANGVLSSPNPHPIGWEILVISDGSKDKTTDTALAFARSQSAAVAQSIRVTLLVENRGKGGAVTHGMRHVRGQYVLFADADGASKFEDLGKLVQEAKKIEDVKGRAVVVGSRAHLVGSEEVVKRSFLRNLLMHSFHLLLWILTPPATASIRDTQCGFKLFSRASLPEIIPYMHSEGWIFDVEMLMLAELAGIPVAEVPIGWHEVNGSKLNVLWDSMSMAWGLFILRAAWSMGVYRRD
ncbi:MAG: hypothetical protein Q9190_007021 [Brigantiaea leucoxantha]